jgi:hypothetical protein
MGKQQVNTGKGSTTINTNNVWERIVALENGIAGVPSDVSQQLSGKADKTVVDGLASSLAEITTLISSFPIQIPELDDTSRIQRAIDYLDGFGGGELRFPKGTYTISNRLMLKNNITLKGNSAKIKLANNIPLTISGSTNWNGATLLWLENVSNVKILDLELDGNMANQQSTSNGIFNGIQIKGSDHITIKGCTIHDMQYVGIQGSAIDQTNYPLSQSSKGAQYLTVTENTFYNLQQSMQITESDSHNIIFSKNFVYNLTDHGLSTYPGVRYISIVDNKIKDIGSDVNLHGACIRLLEVTDAIVTNNVVENPHIHAIYVNTITPVEYTTVNRVIISNNIVKGGARLGDQGNAISVNGNNVTLSGNEVFDFTANTFASGISITGDNNTITGNLVNNAKYGINVNGNNSSISGNTLIDCATYGIVIGGTIASNGTINGNTINGKNLNTLVGLRFQNFSNGAILSGNRISGATTTIQDTGSGTQINDVPVITKKYASYTIVQADGTILGSASAGAITLTLPDATKVNGRTYVIKKFDTTANTVTINTVSSQTIDGVATNVLSAAYAKVKLQSDGANWWIV